MERLFVFIIVVLFPVSISLSAHSYWVVWNVGQGEWVTHVTEDRCYHFDMGGEKFPRLALRAACASKMNLGYFSHWDLDHVGFAAKAKGLFPRLCLAQAPIGETTARKRQLFDGWAHCDVDSSVQIWQPPLSRSKGRKSANELCQIFQQSQMLVTGDAPMAEEKMFVLDRHEVRTAHWLVLGHHGSRTSTSDVLLNAMPNLRLAIASARRAKYGHPHFETLQRLRAHQIPLLATEEWGNIQIEE